MDDKVKSRKNTDKILKLITSCIKPALLMLWLIKFYGFNKQVQVKY